MNILLLICNTWLNSKSVHAEFHAPITGTFRSAVSLAEQHQAIAKLIIEADLSPQASHRISHHAAQMVCRIRADVKPALLEVSLAEYGLSNAEDITLMRLVEVQLRDLDASTIDALVADKIAIGDWAAHCGYAASALVNPSTLRL